MTGKLFECPECHRRNQCKLLRRVTTEGCEGDYELLFCCDACEHTWQAHLGQAEIEQLRRVAGKIAWTFTIMANEFSEAFRKLKPIIEEWAKVCKEAEKRSKEDG